MWCFSARNWVIEYGAGRVLHDFRFEPMRRIVQTLSGLVLSIMLLSDIRSGTFHVQIGFTDQAIAGIKPFNPSLITVEFDNCVEITFLIECQGCEFHPTIVFL